MARKAGTFAPSMWGRKTILEPRTQRDPLHEPVENSSPPPSQLHLDGAVRARLPARRNTQLLIRRVHARRRTAGDRVHPTATAADVPTHPLSRHAGPHRRARDRRAARARVHRLARLHEAVGRYLAEQGYAVEVPRLPGHGTTWQDLNPAWTDWYDESNSPAFDALHETCAAVVVCGLSMGGSVVLRLAEERGAQVSGVVLVNPFAPTARSSRHCRSSSTSCRCAASSTTSRSPTRTRSATNDSPSRASRRSWRCGRSSARPGPGQPSRRLNFRSTADHVIDTSSSPTVLSGR